MSPVLLISVSVVIFTSTFITLPGGEFSGLYLRLRKYAHHDMDLSGCNLLDACAFRHHDGHPSIHISWIAPDQEVSANGKSQLFIKGINNGN